MSTVSTPRVQLLLHCVSKRKVPKAECSYQLLLFQMMVKHIAENPRMDIEKKKGHVYGVICA